MDAERYAATKGMVENLYALTGAGKWDEVAEQLTDDFRIIEAETLPFGGVYEGKGALQELFTKVFGFWQDPELEYHDITVSEKNVVVMLTFHATSRFNGERLAMHLCEVFHLRDGKFSGITPYYFDTAAICRATGTRVDG